MNSQFLKLSMLLLGGAGQYFVGGQSQNETTVTPVLTGAVRGVHDPAIIHSENYYYIYYTHQRQCLGIIRSPDLTQWEPLGQVFPKMPEWAKREVPDAVDLWAPDIAFFNGRYHLYYSVSAFGKNRSCIGLAVNKTLDPQSRDYLWEDHGKVIESFRSNGWNAIDPQLVVDEQSQPWLAFGSYWSGIKLCSLESQTGKPPKGSLRLLSLAARPKPGAIEAPFIFRRAGYYYLLVSFDSCCRGIQSDYKIMIGRATKLTGPYLDRQGQDMLNGGGTLLVESAGDMRGPGHCSLLQENNQEWLVHHFYDASDKGRPRLRIVKLTWDRDGWPLAAQ
jgi:arabinan endo-1,5-alpha-L-arabinosidase